MNWRVWISISGALTIGIVAALLNRKRVLKEFKNTQLGKNFSLDEFVTTATGLDNIPGPEEIENLHQLVQKILQPLRDAVGKPVIINSAYRSYAVNKAIGGEDDSQHLFGQAADIRIPGMTNEQIISKIRTLRLPYDQVIDEVKKDSSWVHVSHNPRTAQRLEWLTFRDGRYATVKIGLA